MIVFGILGAFLWDDMNQDQLSEIINSDHGRLNELMNPWLGWIHQRI